MNKEEPLEHFRSIVVTVGVIPGEGEGVVGVKVLLSNQARSKGVSVEHPVHVEEGSILTGRLLSQMKMEQE